MSKQNGKELAVIEKQALQLKKELNDTYLKKVRNFFNNDETRARKFMTSAVACVDKNPKLLECTKESFFKALMNCAEFQLYPIQGEAHIVPFWNGRKRCLEAQYMIGYPGVATLLYRAGTKNITSELVYEGDYFNYSRGLNDTLEHRPVEFSKRGNPIGAWVVVTLASGEKPFMFMHKEDIFLYREKSSGWKDKDGKVISSSPWLEKNDPQLWMWRKTVLNQLAKLLPKNREVAEAISREHEGVVIEAFQGEATDNSALTPDEVSTLFAEGKSRGIKVKRIREIFTAAGSDGEECTLEQREKILEAYDAEVAEKQEPVPEEGEPAKPAASEPLASPKAVKKLIERASATNVDTTGWMARANNLTVTEYNDMLRVVEEAEAEEE